MLTSTRQEKPLPAVSPSSGRTSWPAVTGLCLLALGIIVNWMAMRRTSGYDFTFLYVLAKMLLHGQNAYDPALRHAVGAACCSGIDLELQAYPPSTGFVVLPLAALPLSFARTLWFALCMGVLLLGLATLLRTLAPKLERGKILFLLGLIACSACVRWGFTILQSAPMLTGLFALFTAFLLRNRPLAALISGFLALCLKVTYALPFVGLALLQRRFALAAAMLGLWVLVNGAGFARMGGGEAVHAYRREVARIESPTLVNSPDPHNPLSVMRLDWPYLLNAIHPDVPLMGNIGLGLTLISLVWLAWEGLRCAPICREAGTLRVFVGPLVCLSLLMVYHHHYEAVLLLVPLLAYVDYNGSEDLRRRRGLLWFTVPVLLTISVLPVDKMQSLLRRHFGEAGLLYFKPIGCVVVIIAFAASLFLLHPYLDRRMKTLTPDLSPR